MALSFEEAALNTAYHAVFDVKDRLTPGSPKAYLAYEACSKIADLMVSLGHEPPKRFDEQGRTDGTP